MAIAKSVSPASEPFDEEVFNRDDPRSPFSEAAHPFGEAMRDMATLIDDSSMSKFEKSVGRQYHRKINASAIEWLRAVDAFLREANAKALNQAFEEGKAAARAELELGR